MKAYQIKNNIYWVGSKDWNLRNFHGYKTNRGSTYNAYLILDDKKVLIDSTKTELFDEMFFRISSLIDPASIDIIVSNHVEMDHSGNIPKILEYCPNAKVISSIKGVQGLGKHYDTSKWNLTSVKDGETLSIGKCTLSFHHTPMIHWPDNMLTYLKEEAILFSNDAFGQHLVDDEIFVSKTKKDIVFEETAKYYANIVLPYGVQVQKALNTLSSLKISIIAPSHGMIWDTNIPELMKKYHAWSKYENAGTALVVYDSMWGSTKKMADTIVYAFEKQGIPVVLKSLKENHISEIVANVLEAKYIALGSSTINNGILPTMASFISYVKGLAPKNKIAFIFGSYGWYNKGLQNIDEIVRALNWKQSAEPFLVNYRPSEADLHNLENRINNLIKEFL